MTASFANGYALLIAVDENVTSDWALPDVLKDATALQRTLTNPDRCAYEPSHVKVVAGKDATRTGILDGLDWLRECLASDPSGNATAFVYYSGHGWRDDAVQPAAYYFVPQDARSQALRLTSLRADDFAQAVASLAPRRLFVVLDCCHAGGMNVKEVATSARPVGASIPPQLIMLDPAGSAPKGSGQGLHALGQGAGRAVLSSSQGTQLSYVRTDRRMSVFTYHLIEALTGHAQPAHGATEVLVSDVMSHVSRRVPETTLAESGNRQDPDYQVSGNFPIALLLGGKGIDRGQTPPAPLDNIAASPTPAAGISNSVGSAQIGNLTNHDSTFVGRDNIVDEHSSRGDVIKTGDISNSIGLAIGRHASSSVNALSGDHLEKLFAQLQSSAASVATESRERALAAVAALKDEIAKGSAAEDRKIARLIDGLVDLVPAAIGAVTSLFATPALSVIAGNATRFVLDKLKNN